MEHRPKPRYRIATVSIDEEGNFWVDWMGTSSGNGGSFFGPTNAGMKSAEAVMKIAGIDLDKYKDHFLKQIEEVKKKEEQ